MTTKENIQEYFKDPKTLQECLKNERLEDTLLILSNNFISEIRQNLLYHDTYKDSIDTIFPAYLDAALLSCIPEIYQQNGMKITKEIFFHQIGQENGTKENDISRVCGYVFQRHDIAFNCRDCQADNTCVVCLPCYQNGCHEGHDVTFHPTGLGGVCDCGDVEAWNPNGFCSLHKGAESTSTIEDERNEEQDMNMEEEDENVSIQQIANVLFDALLSFAVQHVNRTEKNFVLDDWVLEIQNQMEKQMTEMENIHFPLHLRIHNDDVHSDEDLVDSLTKKNICDETPRVVVRAIDAEGCRIVKKNCSPSKALKLLKALQEEKWLVSLVTDQFLVEEQMFLAMLEWFQSIMNLSRPLHRMLCKKLFHADNEVSKCILYHWLAVDPFYRKEIAVTLYKFSLQLQQYKKETKLLFADVFFQLYPHLMSHFYHGRGTQRESFLVVGVQLFTAPSVVYHLEKSYGLIRHLLEILIKGIKVVCKARNKRNKRVEFGNPIVKYRRYRFVLEGLRYCLLIPGVASQYFLQIPDRVDQLMSVLQCLDYMDAYTRIPAGQDHIELENEQWVEAFLLDKDMCCPFDPMIKALRYQPNHSTEKERHNMIKNVLHSFWNRVTAMMGTLGNEMVEWHQPSTKGLFPLDDNAKIIKFYVSKEPVSFHLPLHRLFARIVRERLYIPQSNSQSWQDWLFDSPTPSASKLITEHLLEIPLRTLVFCSQIRANMWVRNGENLMRQMQHYVQTFTADFRDQDLFLVQIAAASIPVNTFFQSFFDRFGVLEYLGAWRHRQTNSGAITDQHDLDIDLETPEQATRMIEAALLCLIILLTDLPQPIESLRCPKENGNDAYLRREFVHKLAVGPCRLSELLEHIKDLLNFNTAFTSTIQNPLDRVRSILADIATISKASEQANKSSTPPLYSLKKEIYMQEYDPTFYHLSGPDHETAHVYLMEECLKKWTEEMSKAGPERSFMQPLVASLPACHPTMHHVRHMVLNTSFLSIIQLILEDASLQVVNQNSKGVEKSTVNNKAPQSTPAMQMYCVHLLHIVVLVMQSLEPQNYTGLLSQNGLLKLLTCGPRDFLDDKMYEPNTSFQSRSDSGDDVAMNSFKRDFVPTTTQEPNKRVKREEDYDMDEAKDQKDNSQNSNETQNSARTEIHPKSIVASLVQLSTNSDFDTSKRIISALHWLLMQLSAMNVGIHVYVHRNLWHNSLEAKTEDGQQKQVLSKAELRKLHQDRAIAAMAAKRKAFASSTAYTMDDVDSSDNEDKEMPSVSGSEQHLIAYHALPPPDCIICTEKLKDEPIMYIGQAQGSKALHHARVHHSVSTATQSLACDTNDDSESHANETLAPDIFLSLCGHAIHLKCWKTYFASVFSRARGGALHLRGLGLDQQTIAFDSRLGEFLCPLCNTLSSMLVPHVDVSPSLTIEELTNNRAAMELVFQAKYDPVSIGTWLTVGLPEFLYSQDENCYSNGKVDGSAIQHFALSLVEAIVRFHPVSKPLTEVMQIIQKTEFTSGLRLLHLMWSAITATIRIIETSAISQVLVEHQETLTDLSLNDRLGVSLSDTVNVKLNNLLPSKNDSKLNCLVRALSLAPLLMASDTEQPLFHNNICQPLHDLIQLIDLTTTSSSEQLSALPLWLNSPVLLEQDLLYICIISVGNMLTKKAMVVNTIRAIGILGFAQALLQIFHLVAEVDMSQEDLQSQSQESADLETLMMHLVKFSGFDERLEMGHHPPRGNQLLTMFHATCNTFLRQLTLVVRTVFRGEGDPDAECYLNFLNSLSLSTNFHEMRKQLGIPCIHQILQNHMIMDYLTRAACQFKHIPHSWDSKEPQTTDKSTKGTLSFLRNLLRSIQITPSDGSISQNDSQSGHFDVSHLTEGKFPLLSFHLQDPLSPSPLYELSTIRLVKMNHDYIDTYSDVLFSAVPEIESDGAANVRKHKQQVGQKWRPRLCRTTGEPMDNPAICLACGEVLCAGSSCCRKENALGISAGACTQHTMKCGAGIGIFFLLRSCLILLIHGTRSSYLGSIYVDMFGEEDANLSRGRLLHLDFSNRYLRLLRLYSQHEVANEVSRNRRTSQQYIRANFY